MSTAISKSALAGPTVTFAIGIDDGQMVSQFCRHVIVLKMQESFPKTTR
jgi:hypothetical protein